MEESHAIKYNKIAFICRFADTNAKKKISWAILVLTNGKRRIIYNIIDERNGEKINL